MPLKDVKFFNFLNREERIRKFSIVVDNYTTDACYLKSKVINENKIKRAFDFFLSIFIIVFIFSWLFPIIAICIKLTSKGPVFFIQNRIGKNGIVFRCYKFRTMHVIKKIAIYEPTIHNDPRITKVGVYLRKSNFDELPQIINVFKNEMSIVGPRPHAIPFQEFYGKFIENIHQRQYIKPGITGLAQIKGYRGDVEDVEENKKLTQKRIEYDLKYIQEWSNKLDFKIITTTIIQMIFRKSNGR